MGERGTPPLPPRMRGGWGGDACGGGVTHAGGWGVTPAGGWGVMAH